MYVFPFLQIFHLQIHNAGHSGEDLVGYTAHYYVRLTAVFPKLSNPLYMQASSLEGHWSHYGVGVVSTSNTQLWTLKAGVLARPAPGGHWRAGTEEGL